jgi:hypothetical protein
MPELLGQTQLNTEQRIELYSDSTLWIIDDGQNRRIKLDAASATQLYDFLLLHMASLHQPATKLIDTDW